MADCLQYVQFGLSKTDEPELFKAAVMTIGDISRGVSKVFLPYIDDFVPGIL